MQRQLTPAQGRVQP